MSDSIFINHENTLLYYDGPQIFVGVDAEKRMYLCLLVDETQTCNIYLCAPTDSETLDAFVAGKMALDVLLDKASCLYKAMVLSIQDPILLSPMDKESVPKDWLPTPGFTIKLKEQIKENTHASYHL